MQKIKNNIVSNMVLKNFERFYILITERKTQKKKQYCLKNMVLKNFERFYILIMQQKIVIRRRLALVLLSGIKTNANKAF